MKETNDFFEQYNISSDLTINMDVDYGVDSVDYNLDIPDIIVETGEMGGMNDIPTVKFNISHADVPKAKNAEVKQPEHRQAAPKQPEQKQPEHKQPNKQVNNYNQRVQYTNPPLTQEQHYRLRELFTQFNIVAANPQLARNVSSWKVLFDQYEDKMDFANTRFVGAIVDGLERMNGIELNVWRLFEEELLRYSNNEPVWVNIRNRILNARARTVRGENNVPPNMPNGPYNQTSAAYARQQIHMAAKRAKAEEDAQKTKITVIIWVIIAIIAFCFIVGSAASGASEPEYDNNYYYEYDY